MENDFLNDFFKIIFLADYFDVQYYRGKDINEFKLSLKQKDTKLYEDLCKIYDNLCLSSYDKIKQIYFEALQSYITFKTILKKDITIYNELYKSYELSLDDLTISDNEIQKKEDEIQNIEDVIEIYMNESNILNYIIKIIEPLLKQKNI